MIRTLSTTKTKLPQISQHIFLVDFYFITVDLTAVIFYLLFFSRRVWVRASRVSCHQQRICDLKLLSIGTRFRGLCEWYNIYRSQSRLWFHDRDFYFYYTIHVLVFITTPRPLQLCRYQYKSHPAYIIFIQSPPKGIRSHWKGRVGRVDFF